VLLSRLEVSYSDDKNRGEKLNLDLGQLPQNIALRLKQSGVTVLGTDPEQIDNAEDRHKFSSILDSVGVDQPAWTEAASLDAAKEFAGKVGLVVCTSMRKCS
jgi:carbamoylphosphate synthase large subunit